MSSIDIVFTVSRSCSSSGRTMSLPVCVYVSSIRYRVRFTSSRATSGYSGTFTIDGNGCRFHSESTLYRCRAISSRNSRQKSNDHISGMLACAASAVVGIARRASVQRSIELDSAPLNARRVIGVRQRRRPFPTSLPRPDPFRHTSRLPHLRPKLRCPLAGSPDRIRLRLAVASDPRPSEPRAALLPVTGPDAITRQGSNPPFRSDPVRTLALRTAARTISSAANATWGMVRS